MSSLQANYFNTQCCLIWEPYKNLQSRVEAAVLREDPASLEGISNLLRQNFVNFNSLLSPPPKSPQARDIVSKGDTEGLKTSAKPSENIKVDADFVRDALKLSDVLDLDELRGMCDTGTLRILVDEKPSESGDLYCSCHALV